MKNEEVLHRVKKDSNILPTTDEERLSGLVTSCVITSFYKTLLKQR